MIDFEGFIVFLGEDMAEFGVATQKIFFWRE
jgi:hypothetical protein